MAENQYNWPAAFLAYCNDVPLDEIASAFGMPLTTLSARVSTDGWRGLRAKLAETVAVQGSGGAPQVGLSVLGRSADLPAKVQAKLELIQRNRDQAYKDASKLRDHLMTVIERLASGELKLEKVFNNKGFVVRAEVSPGPGDWLNISSYARNVQEMLYRALGDTAPSGKEGSDTGAAAGAAATPAITIILPGAVAGPRTEKVAKGSQVIDLTPLTPGADTSKPAE